MSINVFFFVILRGAAGKVCSNFRAAWRIMMSNEKVLLLGIIQSCFEAAMYIFVFMWTPALEANLPEGEAVSVASFATVMPSCHVFHCVLDQLPHGLVFAGFMICVMIGSRLFSSLVKLQSVESLCRTVFVVATFSLGAPILFPVRVCVALAVLTHLTLVPPPAQSPKAILFGFCVFEVACGVYFPSIGTLRGRFIPEEVRSTIMNFFRIGLNLIVVVVLSNVRHCPVSLPHPMFCDDSTCRPYRLAKCNLTPCSCSVASC